MLEYMFFHEKPYQLFLEYLEQEGLSVETILEDEAFTVLVPEDTDDKLLERVEDRYDTLLDMNRELYDEAQSEDENDYGGASVVVNLSNGSFSYADVNPTVLNKVLQVISPVEFGAMVTAIADAVENPQNKTYCAKQNLLPTITR